MKALGPIIRDSDFPVSLGAIKMLTKVGISWSIHTRAAGVSLSSFCYSCLLQVIEGVDSETVQDNLCDIIPGLVKVGNVWILKINLGYHRTQSYKKKYINF